MFDKPFIILNLENIQYLYLKLDNKKLLKAKS